MTDNLTDGEKKARLSKYLTNLLNAKRLDYGWKYNQSRLAKDIGISQSILSRYMDGGDEGILPGEQTLARIAALTNSLEIYELLGIMAVDRVSEAQLLEIIGGWANKSPETQFNVYKAFRENK